jgi:hypothetical protein
MSGEGAAYDTIKPLKTQEKNDIKASTKASAVSTEGKRNETPLNDYQINEAKNAGKLKGFQIRCQSYR